MSAAAGLMVVGMVFQGGMSISAGRRADKDAKRNAALLAQQAEEAAQWALYNERRLRTEQEYNRGQMLVDLLGNGFAIDEGSTADLLLEKQLVNDEMDALAVRNQGVSDAQALISQAIGQRKSGKTARKVATTQAIGSTLTGIGTALA